MCVCVCAHSICAVNRILWQLVPEMVDLLLLSVFFHNGTFLLFVCDGVGVGIIDVQSSRSKAG